VKWRHERGREADFCWREERIKRKEGDDWYPTWKKRRFVRKGILMYRKSSQINSLGGCDLKSEVQPEK